jgi:diguanylate cyclase (GGDEF)-like protein/PAS domain S-box-containing protein
VKFRKNDIETTDQSGSTALETTTPWVPTVQWVTNDGLPPPMPTDDLLDDDLVFEAQHRVAHYNLLVRHLLHVALTIGAFVFYDGPSREMLLYGLIAATVFGGLLSYLLPKRTSTLSPVPAFVETLVNVVVVVVAPELFPIVVIVACAQFGIAMVSTGAAIACMTSALFVSVYPLSMVLDRKPALDKTTLFMITVAIPAVGYLHRRTNMIERSTRKKYLELLGELDAVVWEADPATLELTFASPQARSVFGTAPMLFIRRWSDFVHPDDKEMVEQQQRGAIEAHEESFSLEHRMVHRNGETVYVRNNYSVQYDGSGRAKRVRGAIVDITRQQEAENTIRKQAQYDTLTGLPNRSLFNDQLKRRLDEHRRTGEGLAVLLLDLNGFKEVNDTLGHAVGDQLLQAIAGRLAAYLPERSLVARLGGDEFAVMVHPSNPRAAAAIAESIAACLQPPITVDAMTIQAGAATGIALFPQDGDMPAALLRRADAAMYEAKQSGRTHMFATPDDDTSNVRRLQLLGELRASITTGDFRLYHQPKIDLRTGAIVGTEGLIRWQHRQFGVLSPAEFVELTEISGLIQPLTRWIVEQGIRDLAEWRKAGYEIMVALNLSVRNFFDQGLPAFIAQLLTDFNVPGDQLVLEITEREVMADRALARTALLAFRSLGVKVSIDDFGTGFSSLSQLQLLPIDEIKVDQSFVSGMLENPQDGVIVRSIIDLGRNLDLEVVAEGAETFEQLAALRDLGADRAQGYVISRPLPGEEFKRWLSKLDHRMIDGKLALIFPGAPLGEAAPGKFGSASGRVLVAAGSRSTDSAPAVAVAVPSASAAVSSVNTMTLSSLRGEPSTTQAAMIVGERRADAAVAASAPAAVAAPAPPTPAAVVAPPPPPPPAPPAPAQSVPAPPATPLSSPPKPQFPTASPGVPQMPKPSAKPLSLPGSTPQPSKSVPGPAQPVSETAEPVLAHSPVPMPSAMQVPVTPPPGPQFSGAPQIPVASPPPAPQPALLSHAPQFSVIPSNPLPIAVAPPVAIATAAPAGAELPPWLRQPEPVAQPALAHAGAVVAVDAETLGLPSDWRNLLS